MGESTMSLSESTASTASKRSAAQQMAKPGDWITQVTIDHGPVDVLGRFFLAADAACRRVGVTLSFGTTADIVETNRRNRDSWKPLMPVYDPAFNDFNDDSAFVFVGRNGAGEIVATQMGRLLPLENETFHDYCSSLKLFYGDPDRMKRPGERAIPTAPTLATMKGRVLFGGAVWYHPSVRKTGLAQLTPRLSRAYGLAKWNIDYNTAFIVEGPLKGGLGRNAGYPHVEWGIGFENTSMGNFTCALCWMDRDYVVADLRRWLADLAAAGAQVDGAVADRRA
jgi:hypothetical protein